MSYNLWELLSLSWIDNYNRISVNLVTDFTIIRYEYNPDYGSYYQIKIINPEEVINNFRTKFKPFVYLWNNNTISWSVSISVIIQLLMRALIFS